MQYPRPLLDGSPPPAATTCPPLRAPSARPRRGGLSRGGLALLPLALLAIAAGVLFGNRVSTEDGRAGAAAALAAGDPARAVTLDEALAGRGGWLMLLDQGAPAAARRAAGSARIAWAGQLAGAGQVDAAVAVLNAVREPSLGAEVERTRAQMLVAAAAAAIRAGHAELALRRLDEAAQGHPPATLLGTIAAMRAADEVAAAAELVAAGRAPRALAVLDDAVAHGGAAAAAASYPATLLAAAQGELASQDFHAARFSLQRLVSVFGSSSEAATARALLGAPQTVSGTMVDGAGRALAVRVRLSTHFTQLPGGYSTSAPFYYGTTAASGDFSIPTVPAGGPYVLEYLRGGGWNTLIDAHTAQPADPVTIAPLTPTDLTFVAVPS